MGPITKRAAIKADELGDSHGDLAEFESGCGSDTGSDTDSDLLDSSTSRKRRRISPSLARPKTISQVPVPPRFKKKKGREEDTLKTGPTPTPAAVPAINPTAPTTATFESLGVKPWLVQSLANMAIRNPTPIQAGCISAILEGRDCIGSSRTGSGKTVAFAVPMLQALAADPSTIFGLVLTPNRELALQIYEQFRAIGARQTLRLALVVGGFDMRAQAIALAERPHIVIATPGRLADHIRSSGADTVSGLRRVRFLVLDEADKLLANEGQKGSLVPDLVTCLEALSPAAQRQNLFFTATMTSAVRARAVQPPKHGKLPVHVCEVDTAEIAVPDTLRQMYLKTPNTHKEHYLHELLRTVGNVDKSCIVFVNRTKTADLLHRLLMLLGHRVTALHSGLAQRERVDNLGRFRAGAARILVATDVASRGLDIPDVKLVVNYDIPLDPDTYVHRVGRTARAGRHGEAVTLMGREADGELVLAIEERVGREMEEWAEEGVNVETRVVRDSLREVTEKKREALLNAEEGRDLKGKRKRGKRKIGREI